MKIMICGPSGAGKTTMAKYISEKYDVPYIHTDGPGLREKFNCSNHSEVIRMSALDPKAGLHYQEELLKQRGELATSENYVMDRSIIDSVAYFLMQNAPYLDDAATFSFIASAVSLLPRVDHLIFIPPLYAGPENDGVRIQNIHYQRMTWQIMQWVSVEYFRQVVCSSAKEAVHRPDAPKRLLLNQWDLNWRKDKVDGFLAK